MRLTASLPIAVATLSLLTACERSPADPCDEPEACIIAGPDLRLESAAVAATAADPVTGLPVAAPAAVPVRVTVRNVGEAAAAATTLVFEFRGGTVATAPVPALAAGASHIAQATVNLRAGDVLFESDVVRLDVRVASDDEDVSNNMLATGAFHIALPVLALRTQLDSLRFTANVPASASIVVENVSRHAALPASTVALCIHDLGARCSGEQGAAALHVTMLSGLAPSQQVRLGAALVIPHDAVSQNLIEAYALATCIGSGVLDASSVMQAGVACSGAQVVHVRPDYEACRPQVLEPDQPVAVQPGCTRPCAIGAYSVSVQPGFTYRIETLDGSEDSTLRWRTRYRDNVADASPLPGLQPAEATTAYAVTAPKFCGEPLPAEVVLRRTPVAP